MKERKVEMQAEEKKREKASTEEKEEEEINMKAVILRRENKWEKENESLNEREIPVFENEWRGKWI